MYLSRLELHGFKSFATRTVIDFAPGITVVVGPNGCGKSNIVDAVRWVIGEQRARVLRSSKMENVIFNGTAKRKPLGMAEVLLTIENTRGVLPTEYAEVTLGRRLYRSGESEYLLNGVPCRLRDITDLFMDTGMGAGAYSVIELKMIDEILSEQAQDRRHLFEEAAGITKYKLRRAQTLRKLDGTQVDLTRLRDLVEELDRRVRSLKRQAAKAERYRDLEARLQALELALAQAEHDRLVGQERALVEALQGLRDRLEGHQARLARAEAELEVLRTRHIEQEQALTQRQAALQEHVDAVRRLEADRRLEAQQLETARRDLDRLARERDEAARQRTVLTRTADELAAACAAARPAREAA
ncbi:AAA family ATPase, partial [Rhodocaloribacter litoris]|uniref:chromosome segregation SMC family protein n=1 Tax=Rhodocaloribacter litoris TaxID=2558931 RepID=UPI001E3771B5